MGLSVVVVSGKGGVGKTMLCANVAAALSKRGKKVLLIDCDFGLRNLDMVLKVADRVVFDLSDVLSGRVLPQKGTICHPELPNLYFLAAPQSYRKGDIDPDKMRCFIEEIKQEFNFVICDSSAGVGDSFRLAAKGADMGFVVTTLDNCAVRDAEKAAFCLEKEGVLDLRLVVNRVRPEPVEAGICMNIDDIIDSVKVRLLGLVPYDTGLEGNSFLCPVTGYGAGRAFDNIARRMLLEDIPLMDIKRQGVFTRILKR